MTRFLTIAALAVLIGGGAVRAQPTDSRDLTVQQVAAATAGKQVGSLRVVAWVNRKDRTYARGETVRLFVANKSDRDVYVSAFDIGPEKPPHVIRLFPNKFQKSQLVKAHQTIEIAGHKHKAEITVSHSQPVGAEVIKIVASTKAGPVIPVSSLTVTGPFFLVKGGVPELVRDLEVVSQPTHEPDEKIAFIALKIKTVAKH